MRRILHITAIGLGLALCLPGFAWQEVVVKKTDSLTSLAAKYHPAGISTMDMVIAIRNANPEVVAHGLKPAMHVRIPTTVTEVRQAITGKMQHSQTNTKDVVKKESTKKEGIPVKAKANTKTTTTTTTSTKTNTVTVDKANAALLAQINADKTTIASLQQGVNNQIQTIQTYQTQITDLTSKLALANQSAASAAANVKAAESWSIGDLFLPIWLITLVLYLRVRRKYKAQTQKQESPLARPQSQQTVAAPCEPNFTGKVGAIVEPEMVQEGTTEWQQVELDIPESDAPVQTNIRLEPLLTTEEKAELVGEQQNIINAISNDHDNIDWHMALLEFYTKTNNENGYQRHYQNMLRSGLMQEGDSLWETVRKIYLNHWVYRTEGA